MQYSSLSDGGDNGSTEFNDNYPQETQDQVCIQGEFFQNPVQPTQKKRRLDQPPPLNNTTNSPLPPPPIPRPPPPRQQLDWRNLQELIQIWYAKHNSASVYDDLQSKLCNLNDHSLCSNCINNTNNTTSHDHLAMPSQKEIDRAWNMKQRQATATFKQLAKWAKPCLETIHLPHGLAVPKSMMQSNTKTQELEDSANALSFLRCLIQCTEITLQICVHQLRQQLVNQKEEVVAMTTLERAKHLSAMLEARVIGPMRSSLWTILSELEPKILWDPRPFWRKQHLNTIWSVYMRVFLLVCFDKYPILKARGSQQNTEPEPSWPTNAFHIRRPLVHLMDFGMKLPVAKEEATILEEDGLGIPDEGNTEAWSMTNLFEAIDILTDAWPMIRYKNPVIELVSRMLLRYAHLGYAVSEEACISQDIAAETAHNMEEYITSEYESSSNNHQSCVRKVRSQTYYADGGDAFRSMMSDFCLLSKADAWMSSLSMQHQSQSHLNGEGDLDDMTSRVRQTMKQFPLARCLWKSLLCTPEDDPLLWRCKSTKLILSHGFSTATAKTDLEQTVDACHSTVVEFLKQRDSEEAYAIFQKSGAVLLLRPGEASRFSRRWPRHACTPLNILNGMRDCDMMRYNERVTQTSVPHTLLEKPDQSLPGDLQTLTDHLVIECIRYMMRTCCTDSATDAFTRYLIEPHQIRTEWSSQCPNPWLDDLSWSFRLCSSVNPRTEAELEIPWEERVLARIIKGCISIMDLPSWPKILNLGGRVLLWNPMGPLCLQLLLTDVNEDGDLRTSEYTEDQCREMERVCAEVLDLSGIAMLGTVVLWLEARILVVGILRDALLNTAAETAASLQRRKQYGKCKERELVDQINDLLSITSDRLEGYRELLKWLIGSLITEEAEEEEPSAEPEDI